MKPLMVIPGPGQRRRGRPLRNLLLTAGLLTVAYLSAFAVGALRYSYPLAHSADAPAALRGAYHVHSTASDGSGSAEEIAAAARAAGLHFVVLTDHNPEALAPPRYHDGVLLVFGAELSTPFGHLVALGASRALTQQERDADPLGTVASLGGHAFLAHPEQHKSPWTDWEGASSAAGLELYSADTMFRTAQQRPFSLLLPAAAAWLTNSVHGLMMVTTAQPALTERLLALGAQRPLAALCAHDAHGTPSYQSTFRTLAMYLPAGPQGLGLPSDPMVAQRQVIDTLTSGQAWCAFHAIAAGDGFRIEGLDAERRATEGDILTVVLPGAVPAEVEVRALGPATVLEDGRRVRLEGAGAVQIEVWARVPGMFLQDGWKPWLVPSPLRVAAGPGPEAALPPPVAEGE